MVFVLFGNATKRVTICFHNFIRGNSRWARYIDNNDDYDDDDDDNNNNNNNTRY